MGGNRSEVDVMQMDGGMGTTAALQEMMLHTRRGVNYLFAGVPDRWGEAGFDGMLTDGAFLVSAQKNDGETGPVRVRSLAGGQFKIANPWRKAAVRRGGKPEKKHSERILTVQMQPEEEVTLFPG